VEAERPRPRPASGQLTTTANATFKVFLQRSFRSGASRPPSCSSPGLMPAWWLYLLSKTKFPKSRRLSGAIRAVAGKPIPPYPLGPVTAPKVAVDSTRASDEGGSSWPASVAPRHRALSAEWWFNETSRRKDSDDDPLVLPIQASTLPTQLSPARVEIWCGCVDRRKATRRPTCWCHRPTQPGDRPRRSETVTPRRPPGPAGRSDIKNAPWNTTRLPRMPKPLN